MGSACCSGVIEFVASDNRPGQSKAVWKICNHLGLSKSQINKLYDRFSLLDSHGEFKLPMKVFFGLNNMEIPWVRKVLLNEIGKDLTDTLNFAEYVIATWSFATCNNELFARQLFQLYDEDHCNNLTNDQYIGMVHEVWGWKQEAQYRKLRDDVHHSVGKGITLDEFLRMANQSPLILFGLLEAQTMCRLAVLGMEDWDYLTLKRQQKFETKSLLVVLQEYNEIEAKQQRQQQPKRPPQQQQQQQQQDQDQQQSPQQTTPGVDTCLTDMVKSIQKHQRVAVKAVGKVHYLRDPMSYLSITHDPTGHVDHRLLCINNNIINNNINNGGNNNNTARSVPHTPRSGAATPRSGGVSHHHRHHHHHHDNNNPEMSFDNNNNDNNDSNNNINNNNNNNNNKNNVEQSFDGLTKFEDGMSCNNDDSNALVNNGSYTTVPQLEVTPHSPHTVFDPFHRNKTNNDDDDDDDRPLLSRLTIGLSRIFGSSLRYAPVSPEKKIRSIDSFEFASNKNFNSFGDNNNNTSSFVNGSYNNGSYNNGSYNNGGSSPSRRHSHTPRSSTLDSLHHLYDYNCSTNNNSNSNNNTSNTHWGFMNASVINEINPRRHSSPNIHANNGTTATMVWQQMLQQVDQTPHRSKPLMRNNTISQ